MFLFSPWRAFTIEVPEFLICGKWSIPILTTNIERETGMLVLNRIVYQLPFLGYRVSMYVVQFLFDHFTTEKLH